MPTERPRPRPSPTTAAPTAAKPSAPASGIPGFLVPDKRTVIVYATLAATAALGVLEWPLAAAAGAGWLGAKIWGPH